MRGARAVQTTFSFPFQRHETFSAEVRALLRGVGMCNPASCHSSTLMCLPILQGVRVSSPPCLPHLLPLRITDNVNRNAKRLLGHPVGHQALRSERPYWRVFLLLPTALPWHQWHQWRLQRPLLRRLEALDVACSPLGPPRPCHPEDGLRRGAMRGARGARGACSSLITENRAPSSKFLWTSGRQSCRP